MSTGCLRSEAGVEATDPVLVETSMSSNAPPAQESAGTTETRTATDQLPSDALKLGEDGEDSTHYFSRIAWRVVVEHPSRGR